MLRRQAPLLWLLSIPLIGLLYSWQNHERTVEHVLATHLDRVTPFVPAFSVFYFFWYPFLLLVLALIFRNDRKAYYRALAAVCVGILLANAIFLAYPTHVPRPALGKGWNYFVPITYKLDEPYNGFPSIHVITSYVLLRASGILSRPVRIAAAVMAWLIILSTLFIKQHVLADVASGIAIGELVFRATGRFARVKPRRQSKDSKWNASN
ncbi:phosphatase PAP2 family protein [Paenibacillus lycopersici]|nr:phosphatase PAP2 family protein [Paenibacillus lycopersici]